MWFAHYNQLICLPVIVCHVEDGHRGRGNQIFDNIFVSITRTIMECCLARCIDGQQWETLGMELLQLQTKTDIERYFLCSSEEIRNKCALLLHCGYFAALTTKGCNTVMSGRHLLTFQRNMVPPSSGLKSKPSKQATTKKEVTSSEVYIWLKYQ
jgi:hypothetical protein